MNDDQIIELYFARDERAITATDMKYGAYCCQIADRILSDPMDTEETVSDTWLRAWTTIPPNRPRVLRLYLAKITRNLAFSRYRARNAEKRGSGDVVLALEELSECVSGGEGPEDSLALRTLTDAIGAFLRTQSEQNRNVFIRRYFYLEEIAEISARYSLKESNVLMILARVRKKLKEYLIKEGYDL